MKHLLLVASASAVLLVSQPAPREQVGMLRDGSFLLNSGWALRPAGKQIPLDTLPMSSLLSPDGRFLLVLTAGYNPPSITVFDVKAMRQIGKTQVQDAWLGMAFSPNGRLLYVGGGSAASVYEFSFSNDGELRPERTFLVEPRGTRTPDAFVGDVALSPDGRLIYAAGLFQNTIFVINPQSGMVIERFRTGRRPYRILFHPDGKSFFVSSWADGTVYHHEADTGRQIAAHRVAPHPTDMVWREKKTTLEEGTEPQWKGRLYVAAANTNSVYVIGVSEGKDLRTIETINVALTPRQPIGMTPSALALNADGNRLFIACSDANAVAVADVTEVKTRVLGFVPSGWYPTAVRSLPDGRLLILNGKGGGSSASSVTDGSANDWAARTQTGTLSVVDSFDDNALAQYTKTVKNSSPYKDYKLEGIPSGEPHPVPSRPGERSPIEHVVYIVKENRSFDQLLGDIQRGPTPAQPAVFGESVTPNHHKLAREFVLFDNFYANGDVGADGHNWATAAIAPDYVQKLWPSTYGGRRAKSDYDGGDPAALPPAGYLWSNAAAAGISMRNYGFSTVNLPKPSQDGIQIQTVRDPALKAVTSMQYRGYDLDYPDVERAKVFLRDLAQFEQQGNLPKLLLIRLANDHTSGSAAGKLSPRSAVADNDLALGLILEGLSKSRFWPAMAVFVVEASAQGGTDRVDSHRSIALLASPYAKRAIVDSTLYNSTSVLRTLELIVGLRPMTHFDAGATPMNAAFGNKPDLKAYSAERPRVPLDERNPSTQ